MGALTSPVTTILPALNTAVGFINTISDLSQDFGAQRREQETALRQLKAQQNENMRIARENAALKRATIEADAQSAERRRRSALKRAVARQRAISGGQGISSANGSAQAILLGLFDESDAELADRKRLDNLRKNALGQNIAQQSRLNVLQATQLAERQRLQKTSLFG